MQRTNSTPACASCKHQRKKCTDKCTLAPLFPVEKTREFQAVHKLFGVSNVTKIVKSLPEEDRKDAVDSLIWEASCRQRDPTLGPYAEFRRIYAENRRLYAENRRIYEELKLYKSQNQRLHHHHHHHVPTQGLIGWNNSSTKLMNIGGGNINEYNNTLNYIHETGNSIVDSCLSDYPQCDDQDQNMERERRETTDNGSALILPHSANNFNNSYYFAGQYYQTDAKQTEDSSLWRGSS